MVPRTSLTFTIIATVCITLILKGAGVVLPTYSWLAIGALIGLLSGRFV